MRFVVLLVTFLMVSFGYAQDLNARVEVSSPQVPNVNTRTIQVLQKAITDFLNNRSWSAAALTLNERVDCSFNVIILGYDGVNKYRASVQINSSRPVFATSYNSPILSFKDKYFNFTYTEGDQLDFSENQSLNELSSLLAFYAYVILGMDMASFRDQGGTPLFTKAQNIASYSQSSQNEGWRAMEANDNRYWLISNLLDRKYQPYRSFYYQYHRNGLDHMIADNESSRIKMAGYLELLTNVNRSNTGNVLTNALFTAKANEFVGVFSKMSGNEPMKVFNVLSTLDPSNSSKYEKIK